MKILKQTALVILSLIFFGNVALAQVYYPGKNDIKPSLSPDEQQRRAQEQQTRAIEIRDRVLERNGGNRSAVDVPRRPRITRTAEEEAEINAASKEGMENWEKTKKMLLPPAAYYTKFSRLLKDEKMNLARLFIDKNCDKGKIVNIPELERCADVIPVKGGGSFYSFRLKSNFYFGRDGWDIHFIDSKFVVENTTVQSIISEIGEVELENINLNSEAVKFLNDYKPKKTLAEIKEQRKLLEKGFNSKGFTYSVSAPLKLNSAYVLRSIAFQPKQKTRYNNEKSGTGITLAFKVVGLEKDQSVIIIWKELKTELLRGKLDF